MASPFIFRYQDGRWAKTIYPMIEESFHDGLMFLVLDRDRHTVSAEVALNTQDVFVSVLCFGKWASQVKVYIFCHISLLPWVEASSHPLVQMFVVFLNTPRANLEDLTDSWPYTWEPDKVFQGQHSGLGSVVG